MNSEKFLLAGRLASFHPVTPAPNAPANLPALPASIDAKALAEAIIEAGRRCRGEVPPDLPPEGSLARKILAAAAKARGEVLVS
jgi:hypothetical protein